MLKQLLNLLKTSEPRSEDQKLTDLLISRAENRLSLKENIPEPLRSEQKLTIYQNESDLYGVIQEMYGTGIVPPAQFRDYLNNIQDTYQQTPSGKILIKDVGLFAKRYLSEREENNNNNNKPNDYSKVA